MKSSVEMHLFFNPDVHEVCTGLTVSNLGRRLAVLYVGDVVGAAKNPNMPTKIIMRSPSMLAAEHSRLAQAKKGWKSCAQLLCIKLIYSSFSMQVFAPVKAFLCIKAIKLIYSSQ